MALPQLSTGLETILADEASGAPWGTEGLASDEVFLGRFLLMMMMMMIPASTWAAVTAVTRVRRREVEVLRGAVEGFLAEGRKECAE